MPWEDGYIAVLRGEQVNGIPYVYLGHSKDGSHWDVEREKVPFVDDNGNPKMPHYAYDPVSYTHLKPPCRSRRSEIPAQGESTFRKVKTA